MQPSRSASPARLWKPLSGGKVQCRLCSHYCVIEPGSRGECGVRFNDKGELATFVGDQVAALNLDPVEKKPLYHFYPGTLTFSLGTQGCNLSCSFCQNYSLSQPPRRGEDVAGQTVTPEGLVAGALANDARSLSYTYSEPTVFFELAEATAQLAHDRGLLNILVSNGFQSPEATAALDGLIDAANIDLKAFTEEFYQEQCGARLAPVLKTLKQIKAQGWWLEVTSLLIPGLNDSDAEPSYKLLDREPTPVSTLERAYAIGKEAGLNYVYVGNVPGHDGNNTSCPGCNEVAIERRGFRITGTTLRDGVCRCGARIAGRGLETLDTMGLPLPGGTR
jgi:pyruvate formate lyase activating enzyme